MRRWGWRQGDVGACSGIPEKAIGEKTQEAGWEPTRAGERAGSQAGLEWVLGKHLEMVTTQGCCRMVALARRQPLCHPGVRQKLGWPRSQGNVLRQVFLVSILQRRKTGPKRVT